MSVLKHIEKALVRLTESLPIMFKSGSNQITINSSGEVITCLNNKVVFYKILEVLVSQNNHMVYHLKHNDESHWMRVEYTESGDADVYIGEHHVIASSIKKIIDKM